MADTKLSALTAVVTPAGTDQVYVNQGGTSKRETVTQIGSVFGLSLSSGNVLITPQTGGTYVAIEQIGGTPGTTEFRLSHDGTNAVIRPLSGRIDIQDSSGTPRIGLDPTAGGVGKMYLRVFQLQDQPANGSTSRCRISWDTPNIQGVSGWVYAWTTSTTDATQSADTGLVRIAPKVVGPSDGGATANAWFQNTAGDVRNTADVTNATTTFANLSDLSVSLLAGRKYGFELSMNAVDSTAADGIKLDFNGGSATVTSFSAGIMVAGGGLTDTIGVAVTTALATALTVTTMTGEQNVVVRGHVVCNAAGTFFPRQAQNAHSTGTLTVRLGATLRVWDCAN